MGDINFYYHSTNISIIEESILAYNQSGVAYGILIDVWKLIMAYINSQDIYFIDYDFEFHRHFEDVDNHSVFLNFKRFHNFDVSFNHYENSLENITQYELSEQVMSGTHAQKLENYLFVFQDNFRLLAFTVLQQIVIYISILILPWIFINLNFVAIFLLNLAGQNYYQMMKAAFKDFFGFHQTKGINMCRLIYSFFFTTISLIILIVILTDFIYILITLLAKSNFQAISSMRENGAVACHLNDDQFISSIFANSRDLKGVTGDINGCMDKLFQFEVDVLFINEFSLLQYLQQNPHQSTQLRYQVNLNQKITHILLINKSQPFWFKTAVKQAIQTILKNKLDLLVREKYLPHQAYNDKIKSVIPSTHTFKLTCITISLVFVLILQLTGVAKELNYLRSGRVFKSKGWKTLR